MESRLPFSCFPYVPRQRCIGERAEAGGTRFSASISAAGRSLSLSFWTSMNYSTQDTVSPYREKVTLQFLPVCLRALPAKVLPERPSKEKEKQKKERKRQKEPSKSYASRRPRIQPKEKTDIGSSPRGESRKIHRLLLGAFSRISKYLTDMVVGTPLIAHVEVRRVAWKWLVTNEPSGLSLCRPCPVHRRRRCRCRRQACQPAFFWWDGWMDGCIPTT